MNEIMRALAYGQSLDNALDRETLRLWVCRTFECPINKTVLDVHFAVLIDAGHDHGTQVVSARAWDELGAELLEQLAALGITPRVLDGRKLFGRDEPQPIELATRQHLTASQDTDTTEPTGHTGHARKDQADGEDTAR